MSTHGKVEEHFVIQTAFTMVSIRCFFIEQVLTKVFTDLFIEYLEKEIGCPITYISVGPEREAIIVRD